MLKRYQVLLPEWMGDYAKSLSDKNDISFSEVLRICVASIILARVKPFNDVSREELRKNIDDLMYEARKATEKSLSGVPSGSGR